MHKLPKQLVAEISMTHTNKRYRKYTSYLLIKGPLVNKPHVINGFSQQQTIVPDETSPYNSKCTTAQLHEVDTSTENPKIPF